VDANGQRAPDAEISVRFSVSGVGELAAQSSGTPNEPASFQASVRKTFQGRCLAILRPLGRAEMVKLQTEADNFPASVITTCPE